MLEMVPVETRPLGRLRKGQRGVVHAIVPAPGSTLSPSELESRIVDMGFVEGAPVELVHEGPVGKDPIAVQIRGSVIALRRQEANAILISGID
ncbi:MAG: ferrous iron transport protein A, partial [Armatimonadetes bacterium]|nr:ferrous iron transport protein A [Armatimonadota bacterium]